MSRYIEPAVATKDQMVSQNLRIHEGRPMFSLVEFNIWGACNRLCSFCPVSNPEVYTNKKEGITVENYTKILKDLQAIDFTGTILWSMFSEPLLHKQVYELASITKEILPTAQLHLVSNGDLIRKKDEKLKRLYESGVDRIQFSLYDDDNQFEEFVQIRTRGKFNDHEMSLRRRYYKDGNYGLTVSNRAGLVESNEYRAETEAPIVLSELPMSKPCYYPFYQVAIDYNGDVLLCPHDWAKDLIAGNALKESIWKIWKGKRFEFARSKLMNSDRGFNPCEKCDVHGDLIGEENFEAFKTCR